MLATERHTIKIKQCHYWSINVSRNKTNIPIILIVDDAPENIDVLKGALVSKYTIRPASSGEVALKAAHIRPYPDLVLLDIMMPGMDGYEVCRKLKASETTKNIPVIFVTAKSEVDDELEGLKLGAVDYIAKPFSVPIVQARVKTHLALQAATKKLDKHNRLLLHERELIENIILRMRGADVLDERHLRHLISPVEKTAGDMLLSTFTPEGRQLILLGDFTGHGLPSAIGGPLVTYILHELARRETPGWEIFREINVQLCARLPTGIFFAATLIEITPARNTALLWNSASPESLLIRHGIVQKRFPSGLPPLGILAGLDMAKAAIAISLEKGDRLFAFSDGIIEAKGTNGDMFEMARLEAFLEKSVAEELALDGLMDLLEEYVGSSTHDDDITLVEVQV